jgi:hypothetical protein
MFVFVELIYVQVVPRFIDLSLDPNVCIMRGWDR